MYFLFRINDLSHFMRLNAFVFSAFGLT